MMAIAHAVLDTDTLSAIMRQDPTVIPKARTYLLQHSQFTLSIITRYEILRGLKAKHATKQVVNFDRFCERSRTLPITDEVVVRAAETYATLSEEGKLIVDADILIAASALVYQLSIVTNNEDHFKRIRDLQVENWPK